MKQQRDFVTKRAPVSVLDLPGMERWLSDMAARGFSGAAGQLLHPVFPLPPGNAPEWPPLPPVSRQIWGYRPL